jgi:CHASE3 domain sensor protein
MANFELVVFPLLIAILLLFIATLFFLWHRKKVKESTENVRGRIQSMIFGLSLCILGGFSLFISLFFLISG